MAFFNNAVVTLYRKSISTFTSLGEPTYTTSAIKSNFKCCIVKKDSSVQYVIEGQPVISDFIMSYLGSLDIRNGDIIIDSNKLKYVVIGVSYRGTLIKHVEVILKQGTEQ